MLATMPGTPQILNHALLNELKTMFSGSSSGVQRYLVRNRTLGPPLESNPEIPPSSRNEGLRLLHGLETNLATSLQTPQEA